MDYKHTCSGYGSRSVFVVNLCGCRRTGSKRALQRSTANKHTHRTSASTDTRPAVLAGNGAGDSGAATWYAVSTLESSFAVSICNWAEEANSLTREPCLDLKVQRRPLAKT